MYNIQRLPRVKIMVVHLDRLSTIFMSSSGRAALRRGRVTNLCFKSASYFTHPLTPNCDCITQVCAHTVAAISRIAEQTAL
jgi:hypothetical protein